MFNCETVIVSRSYRSNVNDKRKETTREHIGDIHATLSLLPSLTALSCERFAGILTFTSERVYLFQISETYLLNAAIGKTRWDR